MSNTTPTFRHLALVLTMVVASGAVATTLSAQVSCFPTCDPSDGRFLTFAGAGMGTLSASALEFPITVADDQEEFFLAVFDGETGDSWDLRGEPLLYTLLADPLADGSGSLVIWQGLGDTMPDNDWYEIEVDTGREAMAASGHFFYRLRIEHSSPPEEYDFSSLKLRVSGAALALAPGAFSFAAPVTSVEAFVVLHPSYPDLADTTYTGEWSFYLDLHRPTDLLEVFDGDFDYSSSDCSALDTDDLDTPLDFVPPSATGTPAPEGVASGQSSSQCATTGSPIDDASPYFSRSPSVEYLVSAPTGQTFRNGNPSGNAEWERFSIDTDSFALADYTVDTWLPHGIWTVDAAGIDIQHANSFYFSHPALGVDPSGQPVPLLRPSGITGRASLGTSAGPGIEGVTMRLVDPGSGLTLATTVTDDDGLYSFSTAPGDYTLAISEAEFSSGGALERLTPVSEIEAPVLVTSDRLSQADFVFAAFVLEATKRKGGGSNKYVDLTWKGSGAAQIDVWCDGELVATTANSGWYAYELGHASQAKGVHTFQVCETGTAICSNTASVKR